MLKGLDESLARFYVGSIVMALEYLHEHSIGAGPEVPSLTVTLVRVGGRGRRTGLLHAGTSCSAKAAGGCLPSRCARSGSSSQAAERVGAC